MSRPRLRRDYMPVCLDDALLLVGETRTVLVEDPVAARLAPLLDGHREVTELMAAVAHPRVAVAKALRRLGSHDVLADGPTAGTDGVAAAWDARGVDPELAERHLTGPVLVVDGGSPSTADLVAGMDRAGLRVSIVDIADPGIGDALDGAG